MKKSIISVLKINSRYLQSPRLTNVFKKFGAKGLVVSWRVLFSARRVTKTTLILAKILEHFKAAEENTS